MVALHVCHGLVNFGVQTPEIHAPQNSQKWHAWIDWDIFLFPFVRCHLFVCLSSKCKKTQFLSKTKQRPARESETSYRHISVRCSLLTLLDVILKHFYFTRHFIMTLLGALVVICQDDHARTVCVCPSHFLSTRLQVRPFNLYINPNSLTPYS